MDDYDLPPDVLGFLIDLATEQYHGSACSARDCVADFQRRVRNNANALIGAHYIGGPE